MATTTPNFGWTVPTSSDLVKNGATAIETLGDAIDASLVDLKGGTTGQVLSKATNTDMDFTWTTPSAGGSSFVGAAIYNNTALSASNSTTTTMTFNLELYDTNAFHDNSTNNSRFTIPSGKAGYYEVNYNTVYQGYSSAATLFFLIFVNGSQVVNNKDYAAGGGGEQNYLYTRIINLAVGDYVELKVWQNSGVTREFYVPNGQAQASIKYLGA